MRFVTRTFFGLVIISGQSSVAIMYLRDILVYSDQRIMYLVAAGSLAVALLIGYWGRQADRSDSTSTTGTLFAHSFFALIWLVLLPDRTGTDVLALIAVIGSTVCTAAFGAITTRDMLCRIRDPGRVGYTNIWIITTSLATGLVPIMAGLLIDWLGLTGFRLCFLASGLGGLLTAALLCRTSP